MKILKEHSVALVIDIQEKLFPPMAEGDVTLQAVQKLIQGLKVLSVPLIYSEQYPQGLGVTLPALQPLLVGAKYLTKSSFSCCQAADFIPALELYNRRNVLISGIEAHICVLQTVLDLIDRGYQPIVVADCITSRQLFHKEVAIERMRQEGAIITTVESLLYEMMGTAKDAAFKEILNIIK